MSFGGLPAHLTSMMRDRSEHPLAEAHPGGIPELCQRELRGVLPVHLPSGSPTCGGLVGAQERSPPLCSIAVHTAVCVRNPLPCPELLP